MEIGKDFIDQKEYNSSMGKAVDDKLFFLEKLNLKNFVVVDFGCADGTVLQEFEKRFADKPGYHGYIGYDISTSMIELAKEKWDGQARDILFTTEWAKVVEEVVAKEVDWYKSTRMCTGPIETILILSSVTHELYSYCTVLQIDETWNNIIGLKPDYIVFRDMMWSWADANVDVKHFVKLVQSQDEYKDLLSSFEKEWGSIEVPKNLTHFLLKYRWRVNWDREVKENYFPITLTQLLLRLNKRYEPEYLERVSIPFIESQWKKDFKFSSYPIKTHLKAIFRKRQL